MADETNIYRLPSHANLYGRAIPENTFVVESATRVKKCGVRLNQICQFRPCESTVMIQRTAGSNEVAVVFT